MIALAWRAPTPARGRGSQRGRGTRDARWWGYGRNQVVSGRPGAPPRPERIPVSGAIVWFTGLPASGKSTLARRVHAHFVATGRTAVLLDGDELRNVLDTHSYELADRDRFYRSLAALA